MINNSTNSKSGSNTGNNKGYGRGLQTDGDGRCGKRGPWTDRGKVSTNNDFYRMFPN